MSGRQSGEPSDRLGRPATGILLLAIDRLPCWMMPTHGCRWVTMPALTRLAATGVTFDRVIATCDEPERTFAELCGGGTRAGDWPLVRLAEDRGWSPLLVTDSADLATRSDGGTPAGTGLRVVAVPAVSRRAPAAEESDTALARLFDTAGEALASGAHRLVVVHVTSLGRTWDAPVAFRDAYVDPDDPPAYAGATVPDLEVSDATDPDELVAIRQAFAGQLTLLDHCLDRLLTRMPRDAAHPPGFGWCVLVAGLRGMPLGLHGRVGLRPLPAFGELVHVPGVLVDPACRMAAQRWAGLVTPADLGATLAEHAGGVPEARRATPWCGASLGEVFESWGGAPRDRVVSRVAAGSAVVTPAWHAVETPDRGSAAGVASLRLFAKPDDYFELNDVASRCPADAERLAPVLAAAAADDLARAWSMPLGD